MTAMLVPFRKLHIFTNNENNRLCLPYPLANRFRRHICHTSQRDPRINRTISLRGFRRRSAIPHRNKTFPDAGGRTTQGGSDYDAG